MVDQDTAVVTESVVEPRRPEPDDRWHRRGRDRLGALRERWQIRRGVPDDLGPVVAPDSGAPWPLLVMTALGAAALALGALWSWQAWSDRAAEPIDDLLPMLVATDGPEVIEDEVAASAAPAAAPSPTAIATTAETVVDASKPPTPTPPQTIVVHVSGSVSRPGVVELEDGSRIFDAIAAVGGALEVADLDRVNLAAPLVDGERIHVPAVGEESAPELVPTDRPSPGPGAGGSVGPAPAPTPIMIELNSATATQFEVVPGVGPATAAAIVQTRADRGPFHTVDELLEVPGIGEATLEQLRPYVWVRS